MTVLCKQVSPHHQPTAIVEHSSDASISLDIVINNMVVAQDAQVGWHILMPDCANIHLLIYRCSIPLLTRSCSQPLQ